MTQFSPEGSWVAIPTPMKDDYSVDYDAFRRLVDMNAANGSCALLIGGSAGEVATLSPEERREIIRVVGTYAQDKIPAFFGTGCTTTEATTELTKYAEDNGAFGAVLTAPMYSLPPQSALLDHFATAATAVDFPIALYNNPQRVHVRVAPETVMALNDAAPNFTVDKEAVPEPSHIIEVARLAREQNRNLSIMCCDNPAYGHLPTSITVVNGMANIAGNIDPVRMARISAPISTQLDIGAWRNDYLDFLPLMSSLYWLPNPIILKTMMNLMGLEVGPMRRPLQPVTGELLDQVRAMVERFQLADSYSEYKPKVAVGV